MNKIFYKIQNWEQWPFKILYAPISVCWLWYIIKSRAVWFFTSSNPKITFGGMEGEPKKEMYDLLPKAFYPNTFNILPGEDFNLVLKRIHENNIEYPFIVKPEVSSQGVLLRKIDNEEMLKSYHSKMPWEYMIQSLVEFPMEVSVFYIRHPNQSKGTVTGFLHKVPLHVIGNGKDSLETLLQKHPKGQKRLEELSSKHAENWNRVLPIGEKYMLSYAANHNRGAQFIDLKNQIDEKLVSIFDKISNDINDFFYGRYDIMCESVDDLKQSKNFTILEFNGCGAEPNHFYDTGYTLFGAYREILKHWKALYEISKYNRSIGIAPWSFQDGKKFIVNARALFLEMKRVDNTI